MHGEAFTYTRQTHGLPEPPISEYDLEILEDQPRGPLEGDAEVPGGDFMLGATQDMSFVFDNEKWAHPVQVSPFEISRAPVTNEQFRSFVDDGAYLRQELWSEEGLRWLDENGAEHPVYWSRVGDEWHQRHFDKMGPLNLYAPVIHVNWYEAEAYCRWAGRKRFYPWGETPPRPRHANLDGRLLGPVDVAAFPEGASAFGCRQMMGNVWEWCADDFGPYPDFVRDPYKEYSEPWFGDHKVQRGGSWATRGRMLRNTWRNFATPDRRDLFVGFRTCKR
jgi:gamma-glutamyl hercynylcysteine S-oxide synthase